MSDGRPNKPRRRCYGLTERSAAILITNAGTRWIGPLFVRDFSWCILTWPPHPAVLVFVFVKVLEAREYWEYPYPDLHA